MTTPSQLHAGPAERWILATQHAEKRQRMLTLLQAQPAEAMGRWRLDHHLLQVLPLERVRDVLAQCLDSGAPVVRLWTDAPADYRLGWREQARQIGHQLAAARPRHRLKVKTWQQDDELLAALARPDVWVELTWAHDPALRVPTLSGLSDLAQTQHASAFEAWADTAAGWEAVTQADQSNDSLAESASDTETELQGVADQPEAESASVPTGLVWVSDQPVGPALGGRTSVYAMAASALKASPLTPPTPVEQDLAQWTLTTPAACQAVLRHRAPEAAMVLSVTPTVPSQWQAVKRLRAIIDDRALLRPLSCVLVRQPGSGAVWVGQLPLAGHDLTTLKKQLATADLRLRGQSAAPDEAPR
ncbi:hypothetical protein KAK07_02850 [Ideonella sp. 4Y16]|uniref:hypothetical protein n=1 Tax=Ideonella alba TaxID=2824118 RepID=UPI001B358704|nr:hypothetical protein [Ideonella alba]MBQ0942269.1 hypothetical protein [Ideonella alba]